MSEVKPQLLVLDDEQDTCANLADIFTDLAYDVDVAYDGHAVVRAFEQTTRKHEHALAVHEAGEDGADLVPLAPLHGEETANHVEQRTKHEWLKKSHYTLMANWNALLKALHDLG
jgi:hypothetical protein